MMENINICIVTWLVGKILHPSEADSVQNLEIHPEIT